MKDRQFAWSDEDLRDLLRDSIPCADEVYQLQHGSSATSDFFRRFCDVGHYRAHNSTRQGFYVVTPNGQLLGSINTRSTQRLRRMFTNAFKAWDELSPKERRMDAGMHKALTASWRWEHEFPTEGLALRIHSRDLPRSDPQFDESPRSSKRRRRGWRGWLRRARNLDQAWFRPAEAAQWVPASHELGARHDVPLALVHRLARFHLVDNVRGQTAAFPKASIHSAALESRVVAIHENGHFDLELVGHTAARVDTGKWPRSLTCDLLGTATWDPGEARFTALSLTAIGKRTGATRFNERNNDPGPAPIGFAFELLPPDGPRVAPAFIHRYGWK